MCIRDRGVYSEIYPHDVTPEELAALPNVKGVILNARIDVYKRQGEISKEDYDKWRYHYPEFDKAQTYVKVPPQDLA